MHSVSRQQKKRDGRCWGGKCVATGARQVTMARGLDLSYPREGGRRASCPFHRRTSGIGFSPFAVIGRRSGGDEERRGFCVLRSLRRPAAARRGGPTRNRAFPAKATILPGRP